MKTYELTTLNHFPKSFWLLSRSEQDRFRDIILKWKRSNKEKDVSVFEEILLEELVRLHLLCQRLVNQMQFFSGEKTDYRYVREDHTADITTEDARRKAAEFDKYYIQLCKLKADYLKIALANSINLNITEDGSVHSLFSALNETERNQLDSYRRNVGRSNVGNNGTHEAITE